jgi:methyl-accepting chemotaxis protein
MDELTSTVKQNAENAHAPTSWPCPLFGSGGQGRPGGAAGGGHHGGHPESSRKIVDIIGVIDGIAFQTNILP